MNLKLERLLMSTFENTNPSAQFDTKDKSPTSKTRVHFIVKALALSIATLSGCAVVGPTYTEPTAQQLKVKDQWQAPAASTSNAVAMNQWWNSFNDPLLLNLIASAQANNPTISAALARIDGARSALRIAANSGQPNLNASTSLQRQSTLGSPVFTATQIGVDAGWELDLFGAVKRSSTAAQAQLESSQADFHASRISLASEVANIYIALKTCEANLQVQQLDVTSQVKTLDLTQLKVKAGFSAPADASLLKASVANSRNQLTSLQSECSLLINTLALLTGLDNENIYKNSLATNGQLPKPALFAMSSLPAQLIVMRPDVRSLERLLAASSEQIGIAQANQYPRISLSGNIGLGATRAMGATTDGLTWGFGPAISLPLFDGGRRAAAVDSARARFSESQALVQLKLQSAVSEVQEAMIRLNAAQLREANAQNAVADFEAFYKAAQTRWSVGVGSLLELEEARRLAAGAKVALLRLEQERITQLINLYKSLGGGWDQQLANDSRTNVNTNAK
jgi:outer membrane protein, multidrug efflux system